MRGHGSKIHAVILHNLNWGNVPSWLGAASLLLAFRIFLRDRAASDRAQINQVGLWGAMEGAVKSVPGQDNLRQAIVKCWVKNASNLPIYIVGFKSMTQLTSHRDDGEIGLYQDRDQSQDLHAGMRPVAPGEIYTLPMQSRVLWTVKPENTDNTFPMSMHYAVTEVDIIDNAGRKWVCSPANGQPIRVRRYKPWTWKKYQDIIQESADRQPFRTEKELVEHMINFITEIEAS